MQEIWPHIIDIAITAGGAAIMGLFGFVWRTSHKQQALDRRMQANRELTGHEINQLKRDVERIYEHVDKNREWSTSRMMSIVKELPNNK